MSAGGADAGWLRAASSTGGEFGSTGVTGRRLRSEMSMPLSSSTLQGLVRSEPVAEVDARHLVLDERRRLARELHDVVAFNFATIALQAGVAVHVADDHPEQALDALQAIRA